jgi:hypothetical protein
MTHTMTTKEKKKYSVRNYRCYKKPCFVPFSGNGQKICRLYELGKCPPDKSSNTPLVKGGET